MSWLIGQYENSEWNFFLIASVTHNCSIFLFNTVLVIEHSQNHWFPSEITSEEQAEKFYTDDVSLPRSE